jgi:hypothetical protein
MRVIDCQQGDETWVSARLGIITASNMSMIVTPTGDKSDQSGKLMNRLLAEEITGRNCETFKGDIHTARGKEFESEAVARFALTTDEEITTVGFCTTDDGRLGCSPDRFVGTQEGLEVKTGNPDIMVELYLSEKLEQKHRPQTQACLYITGRKRWHTMLYTPDMKPIIITAVRNEPYITTMCGLIERFHSAMAEKKKRLIELGHLEAA